MKHIIVILDESARSFCYYPDTNREPQLIRLGLLKKIILYAQKHNLLINFLVGKKIFPAVI